MSQEQPTPNAGGETDDRPHRKSRLMGGLLLFLGALMIVVVFSGQLDREGNRVRALVGMLAFGGSWIGLGLLLFPWSNRTVKGFTAENNFMIGFRKLPLLWRVWLILALVFTVGAWVAMLPPR
jgi:hypothetical protein